MKVDSTNINQICVMSKEYLKMDLFSRKYQCKANLINKPSRKFLFDMV